MRVACLGTQSVEQASIVAGKQLAVPYLAYRRACRHHPKRHAESRGGRSLQVTKHSPGCRTGHFILSVEAKPELSQPRQAFSPKPASKSAAMLAQHLREHSGTCNAASNRVYNEPVTILDLRPNCVRLCLFVTSLVDTAHT